MRLKSMLLSLLFCAGVSAQSLQLDADPPDSGTEVVHLSMFDIPAGQAGYQAYVTFDPAQLQFDGSFAYDDPFGLEVAPTLEVSPGLIRIARGINVFNGQPPACCDALLVDLCFTIIDADPCDTEIGLTRNSKFSDLNGYPLSAKGGLQLVSTGVFSLCGGDTMALAVATFSTPVTYSGKTMAQLIALADSVSPAGSHVDASQTVKIECWGSGNSGGTDGGGAGAYARKNALSITASSQFDLQVDDANAHNSSSLTNVGGSSEYCVAKSGSDSSTSTGGDAGGSVGDVTKSGGNGGTSTGTLEAGGGGGSSGGTAADGNNGADGVDGTAGNGGAAVAGGGAGGKGAFLGVQAEDGAAPGGGGGGTGSVGSAGGIGGVGRIKITFTIGTSGCGGNLLLLQRRRH